MLKVPGLLASRPGILLLQRREAAFMVQGLLQQRRKNEGQGTAVSRQDTQACERYRMTEKAIRMLAITAKYLNLPRPCVGQIKD